MAGANAQTRTATPDYSTKDVYQIYIEYIRHENELLHQRVTWFVAIQGGVLVAVSYSIQKYFDVFWGKDADPEAALAYGNNVIWAQFLFYWLFICGIGWVAAVTARRSILAALAAQSQIKAKWREHFQDQPAYAYLPELMGGGNQSADRDGGLYARWLPDIFIWVWPIIALLTLCVTGPRTGFPNWVKEILALS